MYKTLYVTSDHGGFELKQQLVTYAKAHTSLDVVDLGPETLIPDDDYPDYVLELVKHLKQDDFGLGVIACRSAEGVCMAANRNTDIRAAVAWNVEVAKKSREHNDANILCLSGDFVSIEDNQAILNSWLQAEYTKEPRHARRLQKIESYFPY